MNSPKCFDTIAKRQMFFVMIEYCWSKPVLGDSGSGSPTKIIKSFVISGKFKSVCCNSNSSIIETVVRRLSYIMDLIVALLNRLSIFVEMCLPKMSIMSDEDPLLKRKMITKLTISLRPQKHCSIFNK